MNQLVQPQEQANTIQIQQVVPATIYLGAVEPENYLWESCSFRVLEEYSGQQRTREYTTDTLVIIDDINPYSIITITCIPPSGRVFNRWINASRNIIGSSNPLVFTTSPGAVSTVYAVISESGFDITTFLTTMMPFIMFMMVIGMLMPITKGLVETKAKR